MSISQSSIKKEKYEVKVRELKRNELSDKLGDSHMNLLPLKKLLIVLMALSLSLFLSFADQTGITVGLTTIGKDLHCEQTINWAGTASLLSNCVCQILFGRLSDIFGRKTVMITCLLILAAADLCCGFAQTGTQFFIFRGFAGIGNGAVSSLSMVILSDVVTLEQRGKFQGILGSSVGIGNSVGPFIMSGFISFYSWRGFYYLMTPLLVLDAGVIYLLIENKKKPQVLSTKEKFQKIDYVGILTATLSLILLLIPISGGGSTYAWNSTLVIVMLVIGGLLFIGFLMVEWKFAHLPMIPLYLFKNKSLCLLLGSNFFFGLCYYGFLYYLPYYFNIIKQKDTIHTSIFLLPLVLTQALGSVVSGQIISRTGHYIFVVIAGYTLWCLANGLLIIWNGETKDWVNIIILLIMGTGVGFTFQPTMVACQAKAKKADRAVVISTRNVLRSFGGAVGIAIGSTIVSNSLLNEISQNEASSSPIPQDYLDYLKNHIYSHVETSTLNSNQVSVIINMYETALRNYFYLLVPFIGLCLISSFFIKDNGLQCIDELPPKQDLESSASSSVNS